jgi:site-specific recombinase XerD
VTNETLEPISPAEAKEMYLNAQKHEVSQSTLDGYHYRLKHFIRGCENFGGLDNMNDLTGRKLQQFKTWRRDDGELNPSHSKSTSMSFVSSFDGANPSITSPRGCTTKS